MINFFKKGCNSIIAVDCSHSLNSSEIEKLQWLFGGATLLDEKSLEGTFIGPRKEMITPWSTNAVEITQNMGLSDISRIEEFEISQKENPEFDKMLQRVYHKLDESIFVVDKQPDPIVHISYLEEYNEQEGLAVSPDEIEYL